MKNLLYILVTLFILTSCGNNEDNVVEKVTDNNSIKNTIKKDINKDINKEDLSKKVDNKLEKEKLLDDNKKKIKEKETIDYNIKIDNERFQKSLDIKKSFTNKGLEYCTKKYFSNDTYNYSNCVLLNIIYDDKLTCKNFIELHGKEKYKDGYNAFIYNLDKCNTLVNSMKNFLDFEKGKSFYKSVNRDLFGDENPDLFINLLREKENKKSGFSDSNSASVEAPNDIK